MTPTGKFERFWRGLQRDNPGWEFKTWSDDDPRLWPITGHLFHLCNSRSQTSDLMRFELLWREGGVYVDTDCESVQGLAPLLDDPNGFFAGSEDGRHVGSSVIGAAPGHPALKAYLDSVCEGFDPSQPPNRTTGPGLLTAVVEGRSDVTIHPPVYFYPEPISEREKWAWRRKRASHLRASGAFIVHRWAKSWHRETSWGREYRRARRAASRMKGWLTRHVP